MQACIPHDVTYRPMRRTLGMECVIEIDCAANRDALLELATTICAQYSCATAALHCYPTDSFSLVAHVQNAHIGESQAVREILHQRLGKLQLAVVTKRLDGNPRKLNQC